MKLLRFNNVCISIGFLFLAGCATSTPQSTKSYVWPLPPDPPKIEWVKSYYSQYDFPISGFQSFLNKLLGREDELMFQKPIDVKSNGKGLVYVTDIFNSSIHIFDIANNKLSIWNRGIDPDKDLMVIPYFIALDRNDNLYVVGSGDSKIYVMDKNGSVTRKISFEKYVKAPGGIVLNSENNRIYLVDMGNSIVAVFDISGKHLFSFGKYGEGDGELNRPTTVTINHKGEIIVADSMNARIQIFNSEGKFLRKFGQRGDSGADFQILKGVAVDSDDNIYVTDAKGNQFKIFSTNGDHLLSIGKAHSVTYTMRESPGGFLLPQGIAIDDNDRIYIADSANLRFQVFKYLGGKAAKKDLPPKAPQ